MYDIGAFEEDTSFLVRPVIRDRILLLVEVLKQTLNVAVLLDVLQRVDGTDTLDAVAIVASAENADVNELVPS